MVFKRRAKRPLTPLAKLIQEGPRTDAQLVIFQIVLSERTALEKRLSLARARTGEKMRVDSTRRKG